MVASSVPYQPLSAIRTEPTIFDQVYGNSHLRRPNSINLNVQWLPAGDHSSIYRWNPNDMNNRKLQTRTFFELGSIREQHQPKAVTPPSSDYTDAYLSAFAPKPFPTRRIYRVAAPVFANVVPIKTLSSINNPIRTSETRFNNINNFQPSFSTPSSTYSSSFVPDIFPKSVPVLTTPFSAPEIKTEKSSEPSIPTSSRPSSFIVPPSSQSVSHHENVDRSKSPSTISTYKLSVPFQPVPSPLLTNIDQSSTNESVVLPSTSVEKHIDRPETLVFQHDEDIRSPCIEKPSPLLTPLLDSPITRIESKNDSEHPQDDELDIISSKPIEILEKTVNKYDSIIDQISDILASVSPLSSTISSMSPGKSALDYELTADGSPILQRKHVEAQPPEEPIITVRNTTIQLIKGKHLIRGDSYDKIITAIADLDNELSPPPENQKLTTSVIEEETEEPIVSQDEQHLTSTTEEDKNELPSLNGTKLDLHTSTETPPADVAYVHDETSEHSDELTSNKKNEKHVSWGEIEVKDEDDEEEEEESSSYLSPTEANGSFEAPLTIAEKEPLNFDESTTVVEQQASPSIPNQLSSSNDEQVITTESNDMPPNTVKRQLTSSSSSDSSSSISDANDQPTTSSDVNESQTSQDEQSNSIETSSKLVKVEELQPDTAVIEDTPVLSLPIVESPISTLDSSISTRFLSSDVYHGYLGDHAQLTEVSCKL